VPHATSLNRCDGNRFSHRRFKMYLLACQRGALAAKPSCSTYNALLSQTTDLMPGVIVNLDRANRDVWGNSFAYRRLCRSRESVE